jgi:hypothetical protein
LWSRYRVPTRTTSCPGYPTFFAVLVALRLAKIAVCLSQAEGATELPMTRRPLRGATDPAQGLRRLPSEFALLLRIIGF